MFISKKKYNELVKRVEALERKRKVTTWEFGRVDLEGLCKQLPNFIDRRIAANKSERLHNREVMSDADKIILYLSKGILPPLNLPESSLKK